MSSYTTYSPYYTTSLYSVFCCFASQLGTVPNNPDGPFLNLIPQPVETEVKMFNSTMVIWVSCDREG